jgi:hypothetical protein
MLLMQDPGSVVVFPPMPSGPPEEVIVIVALAVIIAAVLILRPVAKAWARRLSGADASRIDELEQRVVELEQIGSGDYSVVQSELSDLHERLDFTERMLAQAQRPQVAPDHSTTDETTGFRPAP